MKIEDINISLSHRKRCPLDPEGEGEVEFPFLTVNKDQKPNVFYVCHETLYSYSSPISLSKHLLRLAPIHDLFQTLIKYSCSVSSEGELCNFVGVFGNHSSFVEINQSYRELYIKSESIVSVNAFEVRLDLLHQRRTMPFIWMPWDRTMMHAYLQPPELPESQLFALADYAMEFVNRNHNDVFDVINDINETIHREYQYVKGVTTIFTTPYQVYVEHMGVCQDFTNLMICLLRLLDIPARYRTGYVYTGSENKEMQGSEASHAWVEVYLPYMGWLGFDPTNGCLAEKRHIRVACGRNYRDATPTSGAIFDADEECHQETLSTTVKVRLLNGGENPTLH